MARPAPVTVDRSLPRRAITAASAGNPALLLLLCSVVWWSSLETAREREKGGTGREERVRSNPPIIVVFCDGNKRMTPGEGERGREMDMSFGPNQLELLVVSVTKAGSIK